MIKVFSLTFDILDSLLDMGEGVLAATSFDRPYQHILRSRLRQKKATQIKKWQYTKAVKRLARSGQIRLQEKNGEFFITLTRKGMLNILLQKLGQDFNKKLNWDGKWRVMIWDIPESSRRQRNSVRWFVKSLGFYQLQQSVFITPHPLPNSSVLYLKESGLDKFIRILRVDKIDYDHGLKKHFNLNDKKQILEH